MPAPLSQLRHLRLRRSSQTLYVYDARLKRVVWKQYFPDHVAHVLQLVVSSRIPALHKCGMHMVICVELSVCCRVNVEFWDETVPDAASSPALTWFPSITPNKAFYVMPGYVAPRAIEYVPPAAAPAATEDDESADDPAPGRPWGYYAELIQQSEPHPMSPLQPASDEETVSFGLHVSTSPTVLAVVGFAVAGLLAAVFAALVSRTYPPAPVCQHHRAAVHSHRQAPAPVVSRASSVRELSASSRNSSYMSASTGSLSTGRLADPGLL